MLSRVLIISTNREHSPQPVAPIGAAWIAESLRQAGFEVKFLDLGFCKDPIKEIRSDLHTFKPQGIGLSVRNVDNGDFLSPVSFLPALKEITDVIKAESDARIILGGSGVSVMPYQVLDYLGLDHAVVGDGEDAAVLFFRAEKLGDACRAQGIVCREGPRRENERTEWLTNPDLVQPRMHRWVDVGRYLRYEPVLPVQGKRGCANRCLYCTYNRIEGRSYRLRDPAAVVEEISNSMLYAKARTFEFVDSIFNQPEGYMESLLEEIIRWRLKARFHVSSMSPKGLTRAQVKLMERAGITAVGVTPEAASDVTLSTLRKGFGEDDVHRAAELLGASSIKALWCFLLGGPGEDERTIGKTVKFINGMMSNKDNAFITTGIRIYPKTGMHELALKEGVVSEGDNLLMPRFYFSPHLTPMQVRNILRRDLRSISKAIFLTDTHLSSLTGLRLAGTALRLPSPFWRYAGYMNLMLSGNRVINRDWE